MCEPIDPPVLFLRFFKKNSKVNFTEYLQKFASLKSNRKRVDFVLKSLEDDCPNYHPSFVKDEKSNLKSIAIRKEGNDLYTINKLREALNYYVASIATANSEEVLALAYANRSALLMKLKLYSEALEDIERALQHGYPEDQKGKLMARRMYCSNLRSQVPKNYEPVPTIPENELNPLIQCAKNCVGIVHKEEFGRCVVATKDIEIGEVLAVEQADAVVVIGSKNFFVHCHHCLELCYNLIPCGNCTKALYCSTRCKDGAFASYHQYECPLQLTLDMIKLSPSDRLALKMALMAREEMKKYDYAFISDAVYCSNRLKEIVQLEKHLRKRSPESLLQKTVLVAVLFQLIKTNTTFIGDGVVEYRLKEVLLDLILVCDVNSVNVSELSPSSVHSFYERSTFGTALYSFNALFNHSCVPNVVQQFHGSAVVTWALSSIKQGEQCFVSYGPYYMEHPKEQRQKLLYEQKFFTCKCRACEENWPVQLHVNQTEIANHNSGVFVQAMLRIRKEAHVETAQRELQSLLVKAKYEESVCPPGGDREIKDTLWFCRSVLGNKKRI